MDKFIARENIRRFMDQLKNCTDERQRATLQELLAEYEKRLHEIASVRPEPVRSPPKFLSIGPDGGATRSSAMRMP